MGCLLRAAEAGPTAGAGDADRGREREAVAAPQKSVTYVPGLFCYLSPRLLSLPRICGFVFDNAASLIK